MNQHDRLWYYAICFHGEGYLPTGHQDPSPLRYAKRFDDIPDVSLQENKGRIITRTGPLSSVQKYIAGRVVKIRMVVEEVAV